MTSISPTKKLNIWKWLGIGCGGLLVLGIGGIVALSYFISSAMNLSTDAKTAEKMARSIIDYQLPGPSQGLMSMNVMGMQFVAVRSEQANQATTLFLSKISTSAMQEKNPQKVQEQFEEKLASELQENFQAINSRQEAKQLCGQPTTVEITEGTIDNGNAPALLHQAAVQHKGELILIAAMSTGENLLALNNQVFQSFKCK